MKLYRKFVFHLLWTFSQYCNIFELDFISLSKIFLPPDFILHIFNKLFPTSSDHTPTAHPHTYNGPTPVRK